MAIVKQEPADVPRFESNTATTTLSSPPMTIDLCSTDSDSDGSDDEEARAYLNKLIREEENERSKRVRVSNDNADSGEKRQKIGEFGGGGVVSLTPLVENDLAVENREEVVVGDGVGNGNGNRSGELSRVSSGRQFWKAGDYEGGPRDDWVTTSVGMDHVRVHPRFLHSNATSHKWVLGAFAELLDNALDEVCNGATYVNIDTIPNKKDKSQMLLIEDNGGGMDPDKMRQCMSLGYSVKSKIANTIGQYGNGFKTSTMRLGADVIVFSRCRGKDGKRPTKSIGLLSYTFLRMTGKEDIVVPMLDYERGMGEWKKLMRSGTTQSDWDRNVDTILQWSPFSSEEDLLRQFNMMTDHGTRVVVYNLWEDDQGQLELDFEADKHDIQISGVNRDEKNIQMAKQYPNSRHFLTYRHSLRSYASILYLRLPASFRIILRGKDVEHHNIVNDMIHSEEVTYRPQPGAEGIPRDSNICAVVTIGFVKDAVYHIDVQGFNVYHKNRLIKPFWRIWNACGSDGRGVIGLLEANFVEPAHDKQGFERTSVLSRLENRLVNMQRQYWSNNCQLVGYSQRRGRKLTQLENGDGSPNLQTGKSSQLKTRGTSSVSPSLGQRRYSNGHRHNATLPSKNRMESVSTMPTSSSSGDTDVVELHSMGSNQKPTSSDSACLTDDYSILEQLKEENRLLSERLLEEEDKVISDLQKELESVREKNRLLEAEIDETEKKHEEMNKEQESLIDIFTDERERRDGDEENLKKQLQEAKDRIIELSEKIKRLERK